jgi:phage shock protein C
MNTQLYRSSTDTMVAGVCGGLGQYLGIDPVLIRLFFVLLTLGGGSGVLIYLICWVVIPLEGGAAIASSETMRAGADEIAAQTKKLGGELTAATRAPHPQAALLIGAALLIFGTFALLRNLGLPWISGLQLSMLWPLLLIGGGIALMLRQRQGGAS